jgi:hypothetical protein
MVGVATKKTEQCEEDWQAAQEALRAAQKMPSGPERVEALKKAGQLRYDADEQRRAIEQEGERANEAARLALD